jgi:hypothetical protein
MSAPNTETSTNKDGTPQYGSGQSTDGFNVGRSSGDYVGFYGVTPVVQGTGLAQLTDTSGGTAAAGTGIQALTSSYNSTLIANGISTLAAAVNQVYTLLHNLGVQSN